MSFPSRVSAYVWLITSMQNAHLFEVPPQTAWTGPSGLPQWTKLDGEHFRGRSGFAQECRVKRCVSKIEHERYARLALWTISFRACPIFLLGFEQLRPDYRQFSER
jgi:hypothetical protein